MQTLGDIETQVIDLASRIGATGYALPTFGRTEDGARPHIEVNERGLHYVVVERGVELRRDTTSSADELLWLVFDDITSALSGQYELKHRVHGQDFRRVKFAKQIELQALLSPAWAERTALRLQAILARRPYDDVSDTRVTLSMQLMKDGRSTADAWTEACARYPLPAPDVTAP